MQSVEGMKMLCYELMEAVNGAASESTLAHYGAQANGLTVVLTEKVEQVSLSVCHLYKLSIRDWLG